MVLLPLAASVFWQLKLRLKGFWAQHLQLPASTGGVDIVEQFNVHGFDCLHHATMINLDDN